MKFKLIKILAPVGAMVLLLVAFLLPSQRLPVKVVTVASSPSSVESAAVSNALSVGTNGTSQSIPVGDGKDLTSIRKWAHNELEVQRMVEENRRITRRQLIELKETAAAVMERSRATGETVKQLTVPSFDGKEILFDIHRADLEPSKQVGTFTGQLPDRPNSMVTLSFKFGREAYTIVSPDDGLYLQAWPRDPGEVILTSFDPDVYTSMPEGEPIKTTNTFKAFQ